MLDTQYALEKLAEYREQGHHDYEERIDDPLIGARRMKKLRTTFLAALGLMAAK